MIKQCAWCKSLMVNGIRIDKSPGLISDMSHGICITCKKEMELDFFRHQHSVVGKNETI